MFRLSRKLDLLLHKVNLMSVTLNDIVTKVQALTTVDDSVVALLTDLKNKLDQAIAGGADQATLQEISDALGSQTDRLAAAVTANTPAAASNSAPAAPTA